MDYHITCTDTRKMETQVIDTNNAIIIYSNPLDTGWSSVLHLSSLIMKAIIDKLNIPKLDINSIISKLDVNSLISTFLRNKGGGN